MLHKADRHLIYPEGGIEELKRHDPMLIAEQREQQRRMRQQQRRAPHPLPSRPQSSARPHNQHASDSDDSDESSDLDSDEDDDEASGDDAIQQPQASAPKESGRMLDGPPDATITGLNIQLDSPELIAEWINQRKKRWPTQQVVQQKHKEREERQKRTEAIFGPRPNPYNKRALHTQPSDAALDAGHQDKKAKIDQGPTLGNEGAVEHDQDAAEDDSDSDAAPEEVSSRVPAPALDSEQPTLDAKQDRRPICTHFLQGRCNYGDRCKKRHDTTSAQSSQQQQRPARRPHPRPPPVNPFDQPDLLRQLLRNEIEKHVDAVGQAIRFVVDNDMLLHVETQEGQAEEQRLKREKIQVLPSEPSGVQGEDSASAVEVLEDAPISKPVIEGGMAVTKPISDSSDSRASLYRPSSPTLRPLSSLRYPAEPDPLIYLDPLRRDDPKPLLPTQLTRIALDPVLRSILTPSTPIHPNGHKPSSLERAIISLDALPSDFYRNAAIEMILGITQNTANGSGGLVVTSKDGRRKVSETDLFRMGLRVGGDEVLAIKKMADRLSVLLESSLQLDEVGESDWVLLSKEERDEMRRLHYQREADRLDRLRKLGIDV